MFAGLKKVVKKFVQSLVRIYLAVDDKNSLMSKVSRFVACEMIEGDYLEFGVYQGASFKNAYYWLNKQFESRIALDVGGSGQCESRRNRERLWGGMRFFAFDSFEGLPPLTLEDQKSKDFQVGQYKCSEEQFRKNMVVAGIPVERLYTVKGFFNQTCTAENFSKYGLKKAAIVWLDADLYSSTRDVLEFVTPSLQDGTVLIFDDWFSFRGNPDQGVQKAFYEWSAVLSDRFIFSEYQRDSWKRISFIVSQRELATAGNKV